MSGIKGMKRTPTRSSLRNLKQNKDLSDEEFEAKYQEKAIAFSNEAELDKEFVDLLEEFKLEYDLTDLMPNDKAELEALVFDFVLLKQYQNALKQLALEGPTSDNMMMIKNLNEQRQSLTQEISRLQTDLKIARKDRRTEREADVINFIETIKQKAKRHYKQRMMIVLCPKCKTWIFSGWYLYPEFASNKIHLQCHRTMEDGTICGEVIDLTSKEMLELGGSNLPDLLPESLL